MALLERLRLLKRLQAALSQGHVFISAPAGYGKSTLLRQLARRHPHSHYVPLSPQCDDLAVVQEMLEPLLGANATILLDDIQHVEDSPEIQRWLIAELDGSGAAWLIAGRRLPELLTAHPLGISLVRLDEVDLRFTPAEEDVVLADLVDSRTQAVAEWRHKLQGWPLGISLLSQFITSNAPIDRAEVHLFTFLAEAVFGELPLHLRHFLQVTAIPLAFSDELAAFLLDSDEASTWRREVQRRNLFLDSDEIGWFRYHDLIRDFLLQWSDAELYRYQQRCVDFFVACNDLPNAVEHALSARLWRQAAELVASVPTQWIYAHGRYRTFQRWVETIDESIRMDYARNPGVVAIRYRQGIWRTAANGLTAPGCFYRIGR